MHYDVGGCVICVSNKVEYLNKEESYDNSTKEVILSFQLVLQCNKKTLGKISFQKHFKINNSSNITKINSSSYPTRPHSMIV